jgi:Staphylococcus phage HNH endonuclease
MRLALAPGVSWLFQTPEYRSWRGMIDRCYYSTNASYKNYGAKGITVCERWRSSFILFCNDMGIKPTDEHDIDREDKLRNYEPDNCRWLHRSKNRSHSYAG